MTCSTPPAPPNSETDLVRRAGGLKGLRAIIATFYDVVFEDVMIGYLFWSSNKTHLIEREVEFVARFLGDKSVAYTGRSMREAHAKHAIFDGHFDRRLHILKHAMDQHELDADVRDAWVQHTLALRPVIVTGSCAPES